MAAWDSFFLSNSTLSLPPNLGSGNRSVILAYKSTVTLPEYMYIRMYITKAGGQSEIRERLINTTFSGQVAIYPGVWGFFHIPLNGLYDPLNDGTAIVNRFEFLTGDYTSTITLTNVLGLFLPSFYDVTPYNTWNSLAAETGIGNIEVGPIYPYQFPQVLAGDLVMSVFHASGMRNRTTPSDYKPTDPNTKFAYRETLATTTTNTNGWAMGISAMPMPADPSYSPTIPLEQHYMNTWLTNNTFNRSVTRTARIIVRKPRLYEHTELTNAAGTTSRRMALLGEWDGTAIQPVTPEIT